MLKRRFTHHKTAFCFGDFNNQNHKRQKTDDFRIFADRFFATDLTREQTTRCENRQ